MQREENAVKFAARISVCLQIVGMNFTILDERRKKLQQTDL